MNLKKESAQTDTGVLSGIPSQPSGYEWERPSWNLYSIITSVNVNEGE
jgi:hypothetical protein